MASVKGNFDTIESQTIINNRLYTYYFNELKKLATTVFQWENLPNGISERFIEKTLCESGEGIFIDDKTRGLMFTKVARSGLNSYEEPTIFTPIIIDNSIEENYSKDDSVWVQNDYECMATLEMIALFANKLYTVDSIININLNAQKTPVVVMASENETLTQQQIIMQYEGNVGFIKTKRGFSPETFKVLSTGAPYLVDKLQEHKNNVWNEALTYLGVNNTNINKRERVITDEANANNELIELSGDTMLSFRQKACKEFNEKFKQNISVKYRVKEGVVNE